MNELEERMTWAEYKSRAEGALLQMGAVLYVPNSCLTARVADLDAPACPAPLPATPQVDPICEAQGCERLRDTGADPCEMGECDIARMKERRGQ